MTIKQNLVNGKGETFTLNLIFQDVAGEPVDLTGHSADLVVSKAGNGDTIGTYPGSVDAEGNIGIAVSDEVTDTWPVGKCAYKVVHTTPGGIEKWLVYGALTVISGYDV